MAYNSDDEEMVPDRLVEVTGLVEATLDGLIVEFHVPGIYVSAPGRR